MNGRLRTLSALFALLLGVAGWQPALAQTSDAYAQKIAETQAMRAAMPTQAQREAAAAELKAFKLKIEQAKKAALKQGLSRPANVQLPPGVAAPGPGSTPDYYTTANWAYSPELRKFVDTLPGLGAAGANNLGNYIGVAVPDTISYPGSDYYEISVREYSQKLHSDLPPTRLRGYVQTNKGTDSQGANNVNPPGISYLGPVIVARRDRPVRIKFTNELPTGQGGDLFVPVDETIMGAGKGPLWPITAYGTTVPGVGTIGPTTACDPSPIQSNPPGNAAHGQDCAKFLQNRAAIHLHGGRTPWVSDGTPHQWIIPQGDWVATPYKEGVSLENVPDMPNPGPGSTTYYYSNQQSARLMFYHDHAWGITRLNVLVGMAAGYVIRDQFEDELVAAGVVPADEIPLVIQDRTFVASDIRDTDPTWNWGTGAKDLAGVRAVQEGDLWIPHVYVPAQNPYDPTGSNPYGRWVYGPWFFPPTNNIYFNTVPNPYHDPACSDPDPAVYAFCTTPGQPPVIPGVPHPSVGMETFFDTVMVNGTVYPSLTVQPKAYRFRILNAANDRFWNLNLFKADSTQISRDGRTNTEVKVLQAASANWDPAQLGLFPNWPSDGRDGGVPDPAAIGPKFVMIGTEGGFLPRPVTIEHQPITWVTDPTVFNAGNIDKFALFLGPAERADVIVDFSQYAGQTLILYNDAPAAVPARDPRFDYFTGAADLSATGGYGRVPGSTGFVPGTPGAPVAGPQVGFGPNIRTVMQIKVAAAQPAPAFNVAALEAAFAADPAAQKASLFERAQDPIIVGQDAYNGIYGGVTFPQVWPYWGFSRIQDETLNIVNAAGVQQTFPMEPKGIHDEMGAAFDMEYGRMSGNLGLSNPNRVVGALNFTLYKYPDPATEILNDAVAPGAALLGDGTQIWKISHNGVDTHPIHFHIFDVQVINRVGWDGMIRPPDPTELGWKDTVRISPLEDTIVAMRPWSPKLPFNVPNSMRPLNPSIPLNSPFGFTNIDPITQQAKIPADVNTVVNFGWEYVWHCHILSHEENDMMRAIVLNVNAVAPGAPSGLVAVANMNGQPILSWVDPTPVNYTSQAGFGNPANEIAFRVERATGVGAAFSTIGYSPANVSTYADTTAVAGTYYRYRVVAYNEGGAGTSNTAEFGPAPAAGAATGLSVTANPPSPYLRDVAGMATTFTATATGGSGIYEYRFSLSTDGVNFNVVQAYGPANTWTMPVTQPAGNLTIRTEVRTSAAVANDRLVDTPYVLTVPTAPTGVLLTAPVGQPSPGTIGTAVIFTATGQGSNGAYQYRFLLSADGGTTFAQVQAFGAANTWTMPTTQAVGSYVVKVEARSDLAAAPVSATLPYEIRYLPATTLTLRSNVASPYTLNIVPTPVSFLATGGGSTGAPNTAYNYRFSFSSDGVNFTEVQAYSTNRVWAMPTNTPAGTYTVRAEVKTSLAAATPDKTTDLVFVINNAAAATGVTLSANLPSSQVPGTAVTFTAVGAGSSGYQYRFLLSTNGGAFVEVQPFGSAASWTLPGTTPEDTYAVQAEVKANPLAVAAEATSNTVTMAIRAFAAATGVTITANRTSPAPVNIVPLPTVFTAVGTGSTGGYQYRFSLSTNGGAFAMVQDYGVGSTWTMPASTPIGNYTVKVDVRTSSIVALDASNSTAFQLIAPAPATSVTLTPSIGSPAVQGNPVTFTAAGQGSSGYQYRFYMRLLTSPTFTMVQDYSSVGTWTLPGTTPAGDYQVVVHVRTTSAVLKDAQMSLAFAVRLPPATGLTVTPSVPNPAVQGTAVTFTAAGQGSSGYQYRFYMRPLSATVFTLVQDYSSLPTWTLSASTLVGDYQVVVHVRTSALVDKDLQTTVTYTIRNPPATSVSLTASPVSPSTAGTPVLFTAAGQGSTGYEYRFYMRPLSSTVFTMVRDFSPTATWTLPGTTVAGDYQVVVHVRTSAAVQKDAQMSLTHKLNP